LLSEDERIPVDGVAIAASDKLFQVNMSLLNGEMSPHKKYPLQFGLSQDTSSLEKQDFSKYSELKVTI
jgi:magnesium-transporting ATPase (P-type)